MQKNIITKVLVMFYNISVYTFKIIYIVHNRLRRVYRQIIIHSGIEVVSCMLSK